MQFLIEILENASLKPNFELSKDVINFLYEWVALTPNIKSKRIYFWGGEPLLYWNTIKKTILLFEKINIYPITYVIFSNGLLLNDEIADFCNNHNIVFKMSYDAPNPLAVRNNIPSEENIKSFLKINKRNINFVYNPVFYHKKASLPRTKNKKTGASRARTNHLHPSRHAAPRS